MTAGGQRLENRRCARSDILDNAEFNKLRFARSGATGGASDRCRILHFDVKSLQLEETIFSFVVWICAGPCHLGCACSISRNELHKHLEIGSRGDRAGGQSGDCEETAKPARKVKTSDSVTNAVCHRIIC
jgi:hypothetical protein